MYLSALKKIFSFKGRICRRQYLLLILMVAILGGCLIVAGVPDHIAHMICAILFIPTQVKRFHDMDKSGWLILLFLIPLVNIIMGICLFVCASTKGTNKYGDDPRITQDSAIANSAGIKKGTPNPTGNKWIALGNILGNFILKSTEEAEFLGSLQEKMEMRYFLMLEADRLLFVHLRDYREQIVKGMLARVLEHETLSQKFLDEYNERIIFYMSSRELFSNVGAMPGTRAFVLSHFLQKARGRTRGIDMTDVLLQKRELKLEEMSECLDIIESMMVIAFFSDQLLGIKKIIDEYKKL